MHRGELWWANLPPPAGRRPVLLLSREAAYRVRTSITVAVVTRTIRDIPVEVLLDTEDGAPEKCVVNLDAVMTIPKSLLAGRIAVLNSDKMALVNRAVLFALDIDRDS